MCKQFAYLMYFGLRLLGEFLQIGNDFRFVLGFGQGGCEEGPVVLLFVLLETARFGGRLRRGAL